MRWYENRDEKKEPVEFYRHTLESVHVKSVKTIIPDTKNPLFEKRGFLEEVSHLPIRK